MNPQENVKDGFPQVNQPIATESVAIVEPIVIADQTVDQQGLTTVSSLESNPVVDQQNPLVLDSQNKIALLTRKIEIARNFSLGSLLVGFVGIFTGYFLPLIASVAFAFSLARLSYLDKEISKLKKQINTGLPYKRGILEFIGDIILHLAFIFGLLLVVGFGLCLASFSGSNL